MWMKRDMYILSGTWRCIPSADHTTVYSESAMEFTSGYPSDIPQARLHIPFTRNHIIHQSTILIRTYSQQHAKLTIQAKHIPQVFISYE